MCNSFDFFAVWTLVLVRRVGMGYTAVNDQYMLRYSPNVSLNITIGKDLIPFGSREVEKSRLKAPSSNSPRVGDNSPSGRFLRRD